MFIAMETAIDASALIIKMYKKDVQITQKNDFSPVTEADLASSTLIKMKLAQTQIPIIDEETQVIDYSIRKNWSKVWSVDPLDGTKEFIAQNDHFSVNIALIEHQEAVFGLIADPVQQKMIVGGKKYGVFEFNFSDFANLSNWKRITEPNLDLKYWTIAISQSHHSEKEVQFLKYFKDKYSSEIELKKKGSALKFFDMLHHEVQLYPRFATTMEWDIAAGQAILEGIGGLVLETNTQQKLKYNKPLMYNPNFIAFHPLFLNHFQTFNWHEQNFFN